MTEHNHSLDGIVGYRVVETDRAQDLLGTQRQIVEFNGAHRAGEAQIVAGRITMDPRRGYGAVDRRYSCGCVSVARWDPDIDIAGRNAAEARFELDWRSPIR